MKAKIIKTGEVKELVRRIRPEEFWEDAEFADAAGKRYKYSELEMIPDPEAETLTLEGWVARDFYEDLKLFYGGQEPWHDHENLHVWRSRTGEVMGLPEDSFLGECWNTRLPRKVRITITPVDE